MDMMAAFLAGERLMTFKSVPFTLGATFGAFMLITIANIEEMFQASVVIWELIKEVSYGLFCHAYYLAYSFTYV